MKKTWVYTVLALGLLALAGCNNKQGDDGAMATSTPIPTETPTPTPFVPVVLGEYEAEEAKLAGNVTAKNGYVDGFQKVDADSCTFTVNVEKEGFYDLIFRIASNGGEKLNPVSVDGEPVGDIFTDQTFYQDSVIKRVWLSAGEHTVSVGVSWGWIMLDKMTVQTAAPIPDDLYQVEAKLINPNATDEAKRLMSFLVDMYGKKVLSGQYCDDGAFGKEMQVIQNVTGKQPVILGMDLMDYNGVNQAHGSSLRLPTKVQAYWDKGGIVTLCWHWNTAETYARNEWWGTFYTDSTTFNLKKALNGQDQAGYDMLMKDIDNIAQPLLEIQAAGIPILFRPLHEASGGWFWWGASGPEAYKELWVLLYDKLTNEYGLNNLIWVWNGQAADWYPGDEYVDIVGEDIYPGEKVYTSQATKFFEVAEYSTERKLVYLTENGCIPDPDLLVRDGAMWGMWATWSGEFVRKTVGIKAQLSEQYTEEYMMKKAYEHEAVITLDEMPDLKTYPISESFNK
ncbi:MAG: beta-mannosidase [Lachnospiraceae bacterium]|nr:beta-mannosidase [Lachnospiraceae bacterium]